jgi:prepilin-type N-terminal cleavage/methylation domain-containing protein
VTRKRGFTLIEVLTVIGIIIILVGIVVYGLGKVMGGSKAAATKTTLENLKSMLGEYEVVSKGLNRQPSYQWLNDVDYSNPPMSLWQDFDPGDGAPPEPDPAQAPRDVNLASGTGASGRYSADQIGNTQLVLMLMQQAPSVRTVVTQLPSNQLLEQLPAGLGGPPAGVKLQVQLPNGAVGPYNGAAAKAVPPLILDAWGNPIIFVPSGGLCGGNGGVNDPDTMFVGGKRGDSDAKMVVSLPFDQAPAADQARQIRSPDNRPFWASAGADGNFLTGDDNIYSFEN